MEKEKFTVKLTDYNDGLLCEFTNLKTNELYVLETREHAGCFETHDKTVFRGIKSNVTRELQLYGNIEIKLYRLIEDAEGEFQEEFCHSEVLKIHMEIKDATK